MIHLNQIHQIVVCFPSLFPGKTYYKLRQTLGKYLQASGCATSHTVVVQMSWVLPQDQEFELLVPAWQCCLGRFEEMQAYWKKYITESMLQVFTATPTCSLLSVQCLWLKM